MQMIVGNEVDRMVPRRTVQVIMKQQAADKMSRFVRECPECGGGGSRMLLHQPDQQKKRDKNDHHADPRRPFCRRSSPLGDRCRRWALGGGVCQHGGGTWVTHSF